MKNVKFLPWVGRNYQAGFMGFRTMILGESHYESKNNPDISKSFNETIESVEEQASGDWSKAFWTKTAAAMIGKKPNKDSKRGFWDSVAFYNYVQEPAGGGPRICPANQSWEISATPFQEVLDEIKPEFIIALGYRLWGRLPDLKGQAGPEISRAPQPKTWIYPHTGGSAYVFNIQHPSSGFSPMFWHELICLAREKIKSRQAF